MTVSDLHNVPTHTARIRVLLHHAMELINEPTDLQGWQDMVDRLRQDAGYEWNSEDLAQTLTNKDAAWKRTIRVTLNRWHHNGEFVAWVGRSTYAPLRLNSDDFSEDQVDSENDDGSTAGFIYAYSLNMAPGYLKIGRTNDLDRRIQEHRFDVAKAKLPDAPKLLASWRVPHCVGAEKAVHGTLMLNGKHYRGEGSGTEWFKATLDDVQAILDFVCGEKIIRNGHDD